MDNFSFTLKHDNKKLNINVEPAYSYENGLYYMTVTLPETWIQTLYPDYAAEPTKKLFKEKNQELYDMMLEIEGEVLECLEEISPEHLSNMDKDTVIWNETLFAGNNTIELAIAPNVELTQENK